MPIVSRPRLHSPALAPLFAAALLAGCATSDRFTADVTRFHLGTPVARSTVAIEPVVRGQETTLEFRGYAAAVGQELRWLGFTPVERLNDAEFVGVLSYGQTTREGLAAGRSPVTIGIGGGSWGGNVGVGIGGTFGIGKGGRAKGTVVNMMALQLKRRSDNSVVWEGRAMSEAREGSPNAALSNAVPQLAQALLADFPGRSGVTVRYPARGRS